MRQLEADVRKHIRIEHQLKLHIESIEDRVEELEREEDQYLRKIKQLEPYKAHVQTAKKELKLVEEVLKVKTELSEKQKSEIKTLNKTLETMKIELNKLKETIVKLSVDSNELKTMKNRYQLSLLDGQQELMNGKANAVSENTVQSIDRLSFNDNRAQNSTHQQKKQNVVVNASNIIIRENSKFNQSMSVLDSSKSKGRRSTKKQRDALDNFSTTLLYGTQAVPQ